MEDISYIAEYIRNEAKKLESDINVYSVLRNINNRDNARHRIAKLRTLLSDAERKIDESEQELIKRGLRENDA